MGYPIYLPSLIKEKPRNVLTMLLKLIVWFTVSKTNFYASSGSKLNETARSYKTLATEANSIDGFTFAWFTDGKGWTNARHNLEETFDVMEMIYNIHDLENGIITEKFI